MNRALFLDRDGIINKDYGYVSKIDDFEFTEGIFDLLRLFSSKGYLLFIVTNQSGIGRGYYTQESFDILTSWMLKRLREEQIEIVSVQYCNHAPEENCSCRKPETGMIDAILSLHEIDLKNSWMIGDKQSDIDLAHNSQIGHTISIGERQINNVEYSFKTLFACKGYFEANQSSISL